MMKSFYLPAFLLFVAIFLTAFLPTQRRVKYLEKYEKKMETKVLQKERKNKELRKRIQALKKDSYYLEWMVRKKFNLLRRGEHLVK